MWSAGGAQHSLSHCSCRARYKAHVDTDGETEYQSLKEQDHEQVRPPGHIEDREDCLASGVAVLRHARPREANESREAVEKRRRRAGDRVRVGELPVVHSVVGS